MTGSGATIVLERERGCPGRKMLQRKPQMHTSNPLKSRVTLNHSHMAVGGGGGGGFGSEGWAERTARLEYCKSQAEISVAANCRTGRVGSFDPAKDQNPDRPHFRSKDHAPRIRMCHEAKYSNGTILTECKTKPEQVQRDTQHSLAKDNIKSP